MPDLTTRPSPTGTFAFNQFDEPLVRHQAVKLTEEIKASVCAPHDRRSCYHSHSLINPAGVSQEDRRAECRSHPRSACHLTGEQKGPCSGRRVTLPEPGFVPWIFTQPRSAWLGHISASRSRRRHSLRRENREQTSPIPFNADTVRRARRVRWPSCLHPVLRQTLCDFEEYMLDQAKQIREQHGGIEKHLSIDDLMGKIENCVDRTALVALVEQVFAIHAE
jgi:hypothetical protein